MTPTALRQICLKEPAPFNNLDHSRARVFTKGPRFTYKNGRDLNKHARVLRDFFSVFYYLAENPRIPI